MVRNKIEFYSLPVNGPLRITSPFGQRNTGIPGATSNHAGIDLGRDIHKPETLVLAVAPGEIVQSYWNDYRGWVVVINHGTFQTLSQHLKEKGPAPGTKLTAGQKIGVMGNSGDPKKLKVAVHLHFELHVEGNPVDPQPYLQNIAEEEFDLTESEIRRIVREEIGKELPRIGTEASEAEPSDWAKTFWKWGIDHGITDGSRPRGICTREQNVTMLYKLYDLIGKE